MRVTTCSNRPILEPCSLKNFFYQVDPYIGCEHHCYYCYALNNAETDWTKEIHIHKDMVGQLRGELTKLDPQTLYMGYNSDPYQPCEVKYQQTRRILELFLEKGFSASILTKSDLVARDIDLLRRMDSAAVSVSVAFNDNRTRERFEEHTLDTEVRIEALRKLKDAGVKTGALICPVIPYITNVEKLIDMLTPYTEAIWIYGLSIVDQTDQNWRNIQGILNNHFSHQKEKIEDIILSNDHPYWERLRRDLLRLREVKQLNLHIHL